MGVVKIIVAIVLGIVLLAIMFAIICVFTFAVIAASLPENYEDLTDEQKDLIWEDINKSILLSMNNDNIHYL